MEQSLDLLNSPCRTIRRNAILELPKLPSPKPETVTPTLNRKRYSFSAIKAPTPPVIAVHKTRRQTFIDIHRRYRLNQIISGLSD